MTFGRRSLRALRSFNFGKAIVTGGSTKRSKAGNYKDGRILTTSGEAVTKVAQGTRP